MTKVVIDSEQKEDPKYLPDILHVLGFLYVILIVTVIAL